LKILTVLFIGGAAGTAQLLACERMDGTGWEHLGTSGMVLLPSFCGFLRMFPSVRFILG
jgi:hypothetical protein